MLLNLSASCIGYIHYTSRRQVKETRDGEVMTKIVQSHIKKIPASYDTHYTFIRSSSLRTDSLGIDIVNKNTDHHYDNKSDGDS